MSARSVLFLSHRPLSFFFYPFFSVGLFCVTRVFGGLLYSLFFFDQHLSARMDEFDGAVPEVQRRTQTQAHAPTISAVCVDVRELLRRAAAANFVQTHDASDEPSTSAAASSPAAQLPSVKQQRGQSVLYTNGTAGSSFWAPGTVLGGSAGGPPPLSPADPTILHAILTNPLSAVQAAPSDDAASVMPQRTAWPSRLPPSSRRSYSQTRRTHVLTSSASRFSHRPSGLQNNSRSAAQQLPPYCAGGGASSSSVPPDSKGTHAASEAVHGTMEDAGHPPLSATRALAANVEPVDLSPVAQQALDSVLSHLQTHAARMLGDGAAAHEAEGRERATAYQPPLLSPDVKHGCTPASITHKASARSRIAVSVLARSAETDTDATTRLARKAHEEQHPQLTAFALQDTDLHKTHFSTPQILSGGAVLKGMPPSSLQPQQHQAAAVVTTPWNRASQPELTAPRRTIPPAFRRQLQYAEAAPTTRRPKRK